MAPPQVRKANTETPAALFRSLGGWTGAGAISPMAPCLDGLKWVGWKWLCECEGTLSKPKLEVFLVTVIVKTYCRPQTEGNMKSRKLKWSESQEVQYPNGIESNLILLI